MISVLGYILGCLIAFNLLLLVFKKVRICWRELYHITKSEIRKLHSKNVLKKTLYQILFIVIILLPSILFLVIIPLAFCYHLVRGKNNNTILGYQNTKHRTSQLKNENSLINDINSKIAQFEKDLKRNVKSKKLTNENSSRTIPVKQEFIRPSMILKFRMDLPFSPSRTQIIYVDNHNTPIFSKYVNQHKERIGELFKKRNYQFIYIPDLLNKISLLGNNIIHYTYPNVNYGFVHAKDNITQQQVFETLLCYTSDIDIFKPGLIRYINTEDGFYLFTYYQFIEESDDDIWEQFRAYLSRVDHKYPGVMYQLSSNLSDLGDADHSFPEEGQVIAEEIKQRIKELRQLGIDEMLIQSLFSFDTTSQLSRITINKDYKIFLPDYNNIEIILHPLPKTVYFFFLKHPEGVLFKHLSNHRKELLDIYKAITKREKLDDVEESINAIIDSTKNSINEKCSRIKEAFVQHFDERIAHNYIITGGRFEPKRIILNRDLIIWESET